MLVAVFVIGAAIFSVFDGFILSALSPLWKTENAVERNLKNISSFFSSRLQLEKENTLLRERISSLELERAASVGTETRQILLELLGRKGEKEIVATVLTRPPQSPYDVVVIDAGLDESLAVGSKVFLPEGVFLGTVSEVFYSQARVTLFSASKIETPAVLERGGLPVTLVGVGAGNFTITLPQDTLVEAGDRILSADISSRLLAVVGGTESEPTSSFKEALAKSPVNIFNMRFVIVAP
ncbi:MAG: rod shape-determining protein MreC [Minisyncoccia bacterium]